jgi:hypothetical protein
VFHIAPGKLKGEEGSITSPWFRRQGIGADLGRVGEGDGIESVLERVICERADLGSAVWLIIVKWRDIVALHPAIVFGGASCKDVVTGEFDVLAGETTCCGAAAVDEHVFILGNGVSGQVELQGFLKESLTASDGS